MPVPSKSKRHKLRVALGIVLGVFVALNIYDIISTFIGLSHPGFQELNFITVWFINKIGLVPALLGIKIFEIASIVFVTYATVRYTPRNITDDEAALGIIAVVNGFMLFVLSNNFSLIGYLL